MTYIRPDTATHSPLKSTRSFMLLLPTSRSPENCLQNDFMARPHPQIVFQQTAPKRGEGPPAPGRCWKHKRQCRVFRLNTALKSQCEHTAIFQKPDLQCGRKMDIITPWCNFCCCAECCVHSYRAVGCLPTLRPARNFMFPLIILSYARWNCKSFL